MEKDGLWKTIMLYAKGYKLLVAVFLNLLSKIRGSKL